MHCNVTQQALGGADTFFSAVGTSDFTSNFKLKKPDVCVHTLKKKNGTESKNR